MGYVSVFSAKNLWGWDGAAPHRSSATSWLDGLRGFAALQVYFFHFFGRHTFWGRPFGSSPEDMYLHQTIFIRPFWAGGSGAVSVFFVISGYAITYKSFTLLRQHKQDELYRGLCSSLFRRGFRLYLPVVLLAIPTIFIIQMVDMTDGFVYSTEVKDNIFAQIGNFIWQTDDHLNPFAYKDNDMRPNRYGYVPTSWTIPMEYFGSIVCYLMMMIVSQIEVWKIRCWIIVSLAIYAVHRGSWWSSNFLFGMAIADWNLERRAQAVTLTKTPEPTRFSKRNAFFVAVFLFGFYLEGIPPESITFDFAPVPKVGYQWLYPLIPNIEWAFIWREDIRWYWYLSGNLVFLGISQVMWLQAIFNSKFCQWLGKLSFSLYLCHALVISALSRHLQAVFTQFTDVKFFLCFLEFSVETPIIIVLCVVIERYIDVPSVKFAKWLEHQVYGNGRTTDVPEMARSREQQEMVALVPSA